MQTTGATNAIILFAVGALAVLLMPLSVGYTMAIAAPSSYFEFFRSFGSVPLGSLLWDTFVVFGLSLALPLGVLGTAVVLWLRVRAYSAVVALALGALASLYVLTPLAYGEENIRPMPWWASGAELGILLVSAAIAVMVFVSRRKLTMR